jgi:hypothetical protein
MNWVGRPIALTHDERRFNRSEWTQRARETDLSVTRRCDLGSANNIERRGEISNSVDFTIFGTVWRRSWFASEQIRRPYKLCFATANGHREPTSRYEDH